MPGTMMAPIMMTPALLAAGGTATQPAEPAWSTATATIGQILDHPAARAVLARHLPEIARNPKAAAIARALTLRQLQAFAPDEITDALLAMIDAELADVR